MGPYRRITRYLPPALVCDIVAVAVDSTELSTMSLVPPVTIWVPVQSKHRAPRQFIHPTPLGTHIAMCFSPQLFPRQRLREAPASRTGGDGA